MLFITNDDGIYARGLQALFAALSEIDEVGVVAPFQQQSAVGHAITISEPIRIHRLERDGLWWATTGTPADCVKLGLNLLFKKKPALLISGINLGENVGAALLYSGTVSAATEATMLGIYSVAISLGNTKNPDYSVPAMVARQIAEKILSEGLPEGVFLNVNVPAIRREEIKGIKVTRQGRAYFADFFERRIDPGGMEYFWMSGPMVKLETGEDVDYNALKEGYITITPLKYDLTAYPLMEKIEDWNLSLELGMGA